MVRPDVTGSPVPVAVGLTDAEVAQRVADGKTNDVPTRAARSVSEIVRANVFTRINAILGVLFAIVLSTGSVINGAFGLLIIANSAIGIIQELRAKRTLDKLAIVGQAKPLVRRAGTLPASVLESGRVGAGGDLDGAASRDGKATAFDRVAASWIVGLRGDGARWASAERSAIGVRHARGDWLVDLWRGGRIPGCQDVGHG